MHCCVSTYNSCFVRGTSYTLWAELQDDWTEVLASPADYDMKLGIRLRQDDNLADLLEDIQELQPVLSPIDNTTVIGQTAEFQFTQSETQSLPQQKVVGYAELRKKDGTLVRRLFNMNYTVTD